MSFLCFSASKEHHSEIRDFINSTLESHKDYVIFQLTHSTPQYSYYDKDEKIRLAYTHTVFLTLVKN
jgi:hypothetical protein